MANFYGTGRSNYFKVKDLSAFKTLIEQCSCELIEGGSPDEVGIYF